MPPLKTIPGAWPAQVLIATTSGRLSLPPPCRLAAVTPVAPLPRSGSAGAPLSAPKSSLATGSLTSGLPALSPSAHFLMSGAKFRTPKKIVTRPSRTRMALPIGVSFMAAPRFPGGNLNASRPARPGAGPG